MRTLSDILLLGDTRLYEISAPVVRDEIDDVKKWASDLDNLILQFRAKYGAGRAIAAPQIGIRKRLVCTHIDKPVIMINPELSNLSEETFELWDDCMCFPNLLVRVRRHKSCTLTFRDTRWELHTWDLTDGLSELLQHEIDHLDGILATQRAVSDKAYKLVVRE